MCEQCQKTYLFKENTKVKRMHANILYANQDIETYYGLKGDPQCSLGDE